MDKLVCAIILLLWPALASAHMLNMYDTDRVAELRLSGQAVELRVQFGYKEFPALSVRMAMDRDADDVITDREAAAFSTGLLDSVAARIELRADGARLELAPIREPVVELFDSRGIIPQHCDITLELSAPLSIASGRTKKMQLALTGSGRWPRQGQLIVAVVAGRALEVEHISLPEGTPAGAEQLENIEFSLRRREDRELEQAIKEGERQWRIVRYAQAYYSPVSVKPAPADRPLAVTAAQGKATQDSRGNILRDRVRKYFENGREGLAGLWLVLLAAFAYGAVHALTPGHAKTLTAAYLVGSRHGWPHAVALAGIVTATHTGSILVLAVITKLAWGDGIGLRSQAILGAVSGLIVLALGIRRLRGGGGHSHDHDQDHSDHHSHQHDGHAHDHHHLPPAQEGGYRQILWLGFAGGLAPCPGAIWIFFLALGFGKPGLGLMLIVAMSLGLALVLMAVGLATIYLRGLFDRQGKNSRIFGKITGKVTRALPAVAGTALVLIGSYLVWSSLASMGLI